MQDTVQRSFIVHLPPNYNSANLYSCVFNFHGAGMNGAQQQLYTQMDAVSNANHFIVVYPDGLENSWLVGFTGAYTENRRDVDFVAAVIDTLKTFYNIDATRIFACGLSQGGYLSHYLACELQERIAAVASVAGGASDSVMFYCSNSRYVPALLINGTDDPYVSYSWATKTFSFWGNHNACEPLTDTTDIADTNTDDGSSVKHITYRNCGNGAAVELFSIVGGGHTWADGFLNLSGYGNTNRDINASQEIWNFFNRFSLHGNVSSIATKKEDITLKIFPNPNNGIFTLEFTDDTSREVTVTDIIGKVVVQMQVTKSQQFLLPETAAGIYFLNIVQDNQVKTLRFNVMR